MGRNHPVPLTLLTEHHKARAHGRAAPGCPVRDSILCRGVLRSRSSAILSLAIGIAASSAVFSLMNVALFKPVPGVTRPERLVEISRDVRGELTDVTWEVFERVRKESSVLEDVSAFALVISSIAASNEPVARAGLAITGNYFDLLGVRAALGRTFAPDEASWPSVAPVAVISHEAWQRDFNGDAGVVGRVARINGVPVEVIGVLPEGFAGHHTVLLVDVFLPLGLDDARAAQPRVLLAAEREFDRAAWSARRAMTRRRSRRRGCPKSRTSCSAKPPTSTNSIAYVMDGEQSGVQCLAPCAWRWPRFSRYCSSWLAWRSRWRAPTWPPCCWRGPLTGNVNSPSAARSVRREPESSGSS